ncbi:MAG: hypothetical protein Q9195_004854 [Heterodermia aff. obscurata]
MALASKLVLLTGATGFIGFRTLVEALKAGYRVRAAVRNENGIDRIKGAQSIQPYLSQLEFVLVPKIEEKDAYHEAVKGVDLVIHLSSPTTNFETPPPENEFDETLIQPAVRGTLNLIEAVSKFSPTTKRIVITSSIVAIIEWSEMYMETGTVFDEQSRTSSISKLPSDHFAAYGAGKIAALNATEEYVRTQKPHFEINHIGPSFTIGKNELARTRAELLASTNIAAMTPVLGNAYGPTPSASVLVDDIAKIHVLALDPKIPGGQFFLGVGEESNTKWENSVAIVKKNFPDAVASGTFPLTGKNPTKRLIFDNKYTEKTLGIKFAGFEEQVKSVAGHYLELDN